MFIDLYFQKATGNDTSENAAGFVNLFLIALATFSTAYNVILYIIFNPSFRRAITEILKCRRNVGSLEVNGTNNETHVFPESPEKDDDEKLNGRVLQCHLRIHEHYVIAFIKPAQYIIVLIRYAKMVK